MIATSHVIIGGAAALAVSQFTHNPALGLAAGIVSHFLCDSLPHLDTPPNAKYEGEDIVWDKTLYRFAVTDSLIAFFTTLIIWYFQFDMEFVAMYAWGALGGYLPDLLDNFPLWNKKIHARPLFREFHNFHMWIHNNWRQFYPMPKYWRLGIATQIVTVLPCLYYIFQK